MSNPADNRVEVLLPIEEIVLTEDRAHVTRRGSFRLKSGVGQLRLLSVSPVLVDKTLSVDLVGPGHAQLSEARVLRRRVVLDRDRPALLEQLHGEIVQLEETIRSLQDEQKRVQRRQNDLAQATDQLLQAIAVDVAYGQPDEFTWRDSLDQLSGSQNLLIDQAATLDATLVEQKGNLTRLRQRIGRKPSAEYQAELHLDLLANTEGDYKITISYLVPSASWRPWHTAQLLGSGQIRFQCQACVWQNTGEDWTGAQLHFSTERPSLGMEPPFLSEDLLHVRRKSDTIVAQERDQEIHDTGLGRDPTPGATAQVPGIDDGGEVVRLKSARPATILSDGRPNRVPLFEFEAAAVAAQVLIPEMAEAVVLQTTQTNQARAPLLAGPVDLIRSSGYCGRTSLLYVAPGERFELGWGPNPAFRVHRQERVNQAKQKMLSSWSEQRHEIDIHISNLTQAACPVTLTERVPVSEIEKVEIQPLFKETTKGVRPDEHGFVTWNLEFSPFDHKTVKLVYVLRKHGEVTLANT